MSEKMFTDLEEKIGSWWQSVLKDEMAKAGAEERRIAIERKSFHEGVPAISVICDGGWSKRTHKHSYNAYGGVGVIFGAKTQKLLYIGVRNKHCLQCRKAENQGIEPNPHNCFLNWKESSQGMEADIILSGFLEAESSHGVRYTKIIADGDSSVFSVLQEKVPVWGKSISKLECANHACKCVRSNLEKLVLEKPHYKGKGKLTKNNRVRLTTALRCAIKLRSRSKNVKLLRRDILNSVYHVLGFHNRCSDFLPKKTHPKWRRKLCRKFWSLWGLLWFYFWTAKWVLENTIRKWNEPIQICWKKLLFNVRSQRTNSRRSDYTQSYCR